MYTYIHLLPLSVVLIIFNNLTWNEYYQHISFKAHMTLSFICRCFSMSIHISANCKSRIYIFLVRSHLTCSACALVSTSTQKHQVSWIYPKTRYTLNDNDLTTKLTLLNSIFSVNDVIWTVCEPPIATKIILWTPITV